MAATEVRTKSKTCQTRTFESWFIPQSSILSLPTSLFILQHIFSSQPIQILQPISSSLPTQSSVPCLLRFAILQHPPASRASFLIVSSKLLFLHMISKARTTWRYIHRNEECTTVGIYSAITREEEYLLHSPSRTF